jgi:outer membrane protein assembly factor BamE (lipoprotein component of BamABCDE complex)
MKPHLTRRLVLIVALLAILLVVIQALSFRELKRKTDRPQTRLEQVYESKELIGKTKDQVILLLGNPVGSDLKSDTYEYRIGRSNKSFMPIDEDWLILHFRDDRVTSQEIVTSY